MKTTETVKIKDCKVNDLLMLANGIFRICVFSEIGRGEYIVGKDWVDANGWCHPSGVCFCPGDELVQRVIS
jgi:hypothetical protein